MYNEFLVSMAKSLFSAFLSMGLVAYAGGDTVHILMTGLIIYHATTPLGKVR